MKARKGTITKQTQKKMPSTDSVYRCRHLTLRTETNPNGFLIHVAVYTLASFHQFFYSFKMSGFDGGHFHIINGILFTIVTYQY